MPSLLETRRFLLVIDLDNAGFCSFFALTSLLIGRRLNMPRASSFLSFLSNLHFCPDF